MIFKFNNRDSKSDKKQIWMYAVILFTGAFIILLLTAYSQVKFQNNISEYQNKLSSEQKAKVTVVTDFNAAIKENKRLNTEVESLKEKLVESNQIISSEQEKSTNLQTQLDKTSSTSDLLLMAYEYFNKEDYINCVLILKYDIETQYLSQKALQSYNNLISKSYSKASQQFYRKGYQDYSKKRYGDAVLNFNRVIDFSNKNEYYIDDAYYYLAKSYYKLSDFDNAKKTISLFLINYPKSSFTDNMKDLLRKMV